MRIFKLFFLLIIVISCQNSPNVKMPVTTEVGSEFHEFLNAGTYTAEYYTSKEITTEHKHLLQKISDLIETDNPHIEEYFSRIDEGERPAYNANSGITRQEYNLLMDLFSYKTPETFNGILTISRQGDHFNFNGDGRLSLLDSITVNVNGRVASFKQYKMSRVEDSVDLSDEDIPQDDTLGAFEHYRGPDGILGLTGLDGIYELVIGKLKPSGRFYLSFFARQNDVINHPIPEYITLVFE